MVLFVKNAVTISVSCWSGWKSIVGRPMVGRRAGSMEPMINHGNRYGVNNSFQEGNLLLCSDINASDDLYSSKCREGDRCTVNTDMTTARGGPTDHLTEETGHPGE